MTGFVLIEAGPVRCDQNESRAKFRTRFGKCRKLPRGKNELLCPERESLFQLLQPEKKSTSFLEKNQMLSSNDESISVDFNSRIFELERMLNQKDQDARLAAQAGSKLLEQIESLQRKILEYEKASQVLDQNERKWLISSIGNHSDEHVSKEMDPFVYEASCDMDAIRDGFGMTSEKVHNNRFRKPSTPQRLKCSLKSSLQSPLKSQLNPSPEGESSRELSAYQISSMRQNYENAIASLNKQIAELQLENEEKQQEYQSLTRRFRGVLKHLNHLKTELNDREAIDTDAKPPELPQDNSRKFDLFCIKESKNESELEYDEGSGPVGDKAETNPGVSTASNTSESSSSVAKNSSNSMHYGIDRMEYTEIKEMNNQLSPLEIIDEYSSFNRFDENEYYDRPSLDIELAMRHVFSELKEKVHEMNLVKSRSLADAKRQFSFCYDCQRFQRSSGGLSDISSSNSSDLSVGRIMDDSMNFISKARPTFGSSSNSAEQEQAATQNTHVRNSVQQSLPELNMDECLLSVLRGCTVKMSFLNHKGQKIDPFNGRKILGRMLGKGLSVNYQKKLRDFKLEKGSNDSLYFLNQTLRYVWLNPWLRSIYWIKGASKPNDIIVIKSASTIEHSDKFHYSNSKPSAIQNKVKSATINSVGKVMTEQALLVELASTGNNETSSGYVKLEFLTDEDWQKWTYALKNGGLYCLNNFGDIIT